MFRESANQADPPPFRVSLTIIWPGFFTPSLSWIGKKGPLKVKFLGQELFFLVHFCFASNAGSFLVGIKFCISFEQFLEKKRVEIILIVRPRWVLIKHPGTSKLETGQRYSSNRMWKSNLKILERQLFVPDSFELKLDKRQFQYIPISSHWDEFLR